MDRRSLIVGAAVGSGAALARSTFGQNTSASVTGLLPVAVDTFRGPNGQAISNDLRAALVESRFFQVVHPARGVHVVTGEVGEGYIEGKLLGPDGKSVVSERLDSGDPRLDARRFADKVTHVLVKRRGIASSQIAFVAQRGSQNLPEICLCDGDGRNPRQLTEDGTQNLAPSISHDGSQVLYTAIGGGKAELVLYNLVDGSREKINKTETAHAVGAISPDGKSVAMAAGPSLHVSDLFVTSVKGGRMNRLTATPNPEMTPSWAPDGENLVFTAMPSPNQTALYIIGTGKNAQSTPVQTGLQNCSNPSWSPDGARIAFSSPDPYTRQRFIFVVNLTGGGVRRLVQGDEPVWGADSRHLVHTTTAGLSITDADTGNSRQIVGGMGRVMNPTWTR